MSGSGVEQVITADQARTLLEAATPGPWHLNSEEDQEAGACGDIDSRALELSENGRYYTVPVIVEEMRWDERGEANAALVVAAPDLAHTVVKVTEERDWLSTALQQQEAAYAALEAQYLAVSEAHAALVDKVAALAAEAVR